MKSIKVLILLMLAISACHQPRKPMQTDEQQQLVFKSQGAIDYPLSEEDEQMLDSIQKKTFLFFLHEHHPEWGILKDRAAEWAPSSIASTGFGIPAFAIGAEREWITREQAAQITLNILNFFMNSDQSTDPNGDGYKGFYYHFLKMDTGTREWNCELSSVDTGLLMMGILFARNYYNLDNETENQIRSLADKLVGRMDWDFMQMPDTGRFANTISMGWTPEKGQLDWGWAGYNEALFLYILAAGTGMENAEKSYDAWLSSYKWQTPYKGLAHVAFPPLFGHQFSHAFIDFRGLVDKYMKEKGIDYFENSRRATYVQRQYAMENPHGWVGYDSLCWGVTASDGPTETYNFDDKVFLGYAGRGTSGPDYNYFDDGTIAPYGPLSSLPFAPEIVLPTIKSINEKYGAKLWGKYGYYDAFNPTANWVNDDYIGIDQGPMLIMIENFRTGLVWNYIMQDPVIQKGLSRLGFEYLK
ncbi:MAG: glucoamylase family protein [Bacteroidales bacterium]